MARVRLPVQDQASSLTVFAHSGTVSTGFNGSQARSSQHNTTSRDDDDLSVNTPPFSHQWRHAPLIKRISKAARPACASLLYRPLRLSRRNIQRHLLAAKHCAIRNLLAFAALQMSSAEVSALGVSGGLTASHRNTDRSWST